MKIVSLLPSATEIICGIGLRDQLVGVTHECDYPEDVEGLPVVTRSRIPKGLPSNEIDAIVRGQLETDSALYSLEAEVLASLSPDLIVTQSLCDVCAVSADEVTSVACQLPGNTNVINLEPTCLSDVLETILVVGDAAERSVEAQAYFDSLTQRVEAVVQRTKHIGHDLRPKVAVLEWLDPLFDGGHWYPELIEMAGGTPCFGHPNKPSCSRSWEDLIAAQPDVILVSLCGFNLERTAKDIPLLASRPGFSNLPAAQNGQTYMVDGNCYFSRPGPRLVDSLEILANLLHPEVHFLPKGVPSAMKWSAEA
ncbi:MAG: cobalamin-binding protein [Porticoccus sp.]|nr:cobalamin-binding protein [Porticoccus sp.]